MPLPEDCRFSHVYGSVGQPDRPERLHRPRCAQPVDTIKFCPSLVRHMADGLQGLQWDFFADAAEQMVLRPSQLQDSPVSCS